MAPFALHKVEMADLPEDCNVVQMSAVPDNQESAASVQSQQNVFLLHVLQKQTQLLLLSQLDDMSMKPFFVKSFVTVFEQDLLEIWTIAVEATKARSVANQCQVADQQAIAG